MRRSRVRNRHDAPLVKGLAGIGVPSSAGGYQPVAQTVSDLALAEALLLDQRMATRTASVPFAFRPSSGRYRFRVRPRLRPRRGVVLLFRLP